MKITLYSKTTGELGPIVTADQEALGIYLSATVSYVPGSHQASTHIVDLETGEVVEKAPEGEPSE